MVGVNLLEALAPLTSHQTIKYRFSFQTTYGLAIEASPEEALSIRLITTALNDKLSGESDTAAQQLQAQEPPSNSNALPYRYYIWPDYATSFVWYDPNWPGNPEGEDNAEESQLERRYSPAWCSAREAWVDRYTMAFKSQGCDLGSGKEPFPDPAQRHAWLLEGFLLSCWLALQMDVAQVSYDASSKKYLLAKGEDLGAALLSFLEDVSSE